MIVCLGTTPVYQRTMVFGRLTLDSVNRAREVYDYASGKSVNVARVIQTLGGQVLATGFLGGSRGQMLSRDLDDAGVAHDFVAVTAQTRQCVTVIDVAAGTATELVEESSAVTEQDWARLETKLRELLPRASVWVFSGTLAPGAPADFYARWLPLAQQAGVRAIVDAAGEPLRLAMRHPNVTLKMNREELSSTLSLDLSADEAMIATMREHTPPGGNLVVTLGAGGALASDGQSCWRIGSPKISPVSAVGSGDAFAAGLAIAFSEGKPLPDALRFAVACGAANALTPLAGHLDFRDVERFQSAVTPEELPGPAATRKY